MRSSGASFDLPCLPRELVLHYASERSIVRWQARSLGGERVLSAGEDIKRLIQTYEGFSTCGQMLPEQVWDEPDSPGTRLRCGPMPNTSNCCARLQMAKSSTASIRSMRATSIPRAGRNCGGMSRSIAACGPSKKLQQEILFAFSTRTNSSWYGQRTAGRHSPQHPAAAWAAPAIAPTLRLFRSVRAGAYLGPSIGQTRICGLAIMLKLRSRPINRDPRRDRFSFRRRCDPHLQSCLRRLAFHAAAPALVDAI